MPDQHYKKEDGEHYYSKEIPTETDESIAQRCKHLCPPSFHHFFDPVLPLVCTELSPAKQSLLGMPEVGSFQPRDAQEADTFREDIFNTTQEIVSDERFFC